MKVILFIIAAILVSQTLQACPAKCTVCVNSVCSKCEIGWGGSGTTYAACDVDCRTLPNNSDCAECANGNCIKCASGKTVTVINSKGTCSGFVVKVSSVILIAIAGFLF